MLCGWLVMVFPRMIDMVLRMMDGFLMLVIVLVGFARLGVVIVMGTQNFFSTWY